MTTAPNLMLMRPRRNEAIAWEKTESGVKLIIQHRSWWNRFANRFLGSPLQTFLSLDGPGGRVWELCDGEHTVHDIVKILADEFGAEVEPSVDRTTLYIIQLQQNKLISIGGNA